MISRKRFALAAVAPLFLFACGGGESTAPAAKAPAARTGGRTRGRRFRRVSGKIAFEGTVPAAEKVKLNADPKCAAMHKDGLERWQVHVKDGGLADVLVYVKSGLKGTYPPPAEPAVLDQQGCDYTPHMLGCAPASP